MEARFDAGAQAWADYNQTALGHIRQEVTWHNLGRHLPAITDPQHPPRVLDAGGGSGELALHLVRHGYCVWLLDYAPAMLDKARQAVQDLSDASRGRLNFSLMKVEEVSQAFDPTSFDVVTCHTLIEYLREPRATLGTLATLLRPGGLMSVSFVNRHAEVLRQVWLRHDPAGASTRLEDSGFCANLFGLQGVAYSAEEVSGWLVDLGFSVTATCGVRVFADYVPPMRLDDPGFFEALLSLELAVATRSPYSGVARYIHLIAHKDIEASRNSGMMGSRSNLLY